MSSLSQPLLGERKSTAAQFVLDQAVDSKPDELTKAGVWENQDDGSREATDIGFGVKFLKHFGNAHADKILEYETKQLEERPWAIILEETRRASVLVMPRVVRSILFCSVLAVTFMGVSLLLEEEVMTVITSVNSVVSAGLFFLLGPYVGLCITRWWQMRIEFLGGTWGAVSTFRIRTRALCCSLLKGMSSNLYSGRSRT